MSQRPAAPALGDVAGFRAFYRTYIRPKRYFPLGHVLMHATSVLVGCSFALSQLAHVHVLDTLAIPVWLLIGSGFVYWFHKHVLHRPTRFFYFAYEKHTLQHHRFFDYDHITPDDRHDLHAMLFPWWSAPPLCIASYFVALGLAPLLGNNVAFLSMFMMNAYFGLYELVHTVDHLPDDHWLVRIPVLAYLREHHRLHHDPALMGTRNFNIVIPLFDLLLDAYASKRPERKLSR